MDFSDLLSVYVSISVSGVILVSISCIVGIGIRFAINLFKKI